ncbi:DNA-binding response regulator, OmpR family, contains REC and winged-helix (wHTH) domain [Terribacillus halophilus]|uniref:Heme response regulator HssR n=1 Tax=Terribacillus halophilus TaxID=361279 RepID=A0A1G6I1U6_9BACI|nr:response regulator transcription factor [Terribacillus halophilus]SDC00507.1 DNA-binding response regulator, OmpR family, contains REC and winged-helix (wHTH) domain [Terribacillus halophilus]
MIKILVVDDDLLTRQFIQLLLTEEGYAVSVAEDGMAAWRVLQQDIFNLVVVDVMMPFLDGFTLTAKIKQEMDIPVIVLTAKGQMEDKEQGFLAGTDDYLVKPFEGKELIFRIKALLRRYFRSTEEESIQVGSTIVNKKSYEVRVGRRTFLLPLKEFELLYFLLSHPEQAFTRQQLIDSVWGMEFQGDDRTVDVHIKRLRDRFAELSKDFSIKTIRGVGYAAEMR